MPTQDKTDYTPHRCTSTRPCHRWRTCHHCARRRQAKIADAVEKLFGHSGQLRWTILYSGTSEQETIRKIRADWLKAAAPAGAIWTIEQSRKNQNLHCNIITPAGSKHEPANYRSWTNIITGEVRAVGAYISKPGQMPHPDAYTGNLYGTAGQIWQILAGQTVSPVIAATAAPNIIDKVANIDRTGINKGRTAEQNRAVWALQEAFAEKAPETSRDEYRAIAAKWLPDILESVKRPTRPRSSNEYKSEW